MRTTVIVVFMGDSGNVKYIDIYLMSLKPKVKWGKEI